MSARYTRLRAWILVASALMLAIAPLFLRAHAQPSTALAKPCWPEDKLVGRDTLFGLIPCNDIRALAPGMQRATRCVIAKMDSSGRPVMAFETFRSARRQALLYSYGRTRPGPIVTNVLDPSTGFHFWGIGADLIHPKLKWDAPRGYWQAMGHFAEACGLVAGAFWKALADFPHINWAAWESARQRSPLIRRLQAERKYDSLLIAVGAAR